MSKRWPRDFTPIDSITSRLPVPGGWLVTCDLHQRGTLVGGSITFCPDPDHEWALEKKDEEGESDE